MVRRLTLLLLLLLFASLAHAENVGLAPPGIGMYAPQAMGQFDKGGTCVTVDTKLPRSDRFYFEAHCRVSCTGASAGETSFEALWNPASEPGMFRGDGNLWALLTTRLTMAGKKSCLKAAAIKCKDLARVASVEYLGMHSGAWQMPAEIGCGPSQQPFYSPYDNARAAALRRKPSNPGQSEVQVNLIAEPASTAPVEKQKAALTKSCKSPISVSVCFGDCLCDPGALSECPKNSENGRWSEVLGTRLPPATRELHLCADSLVDELGSMGLSRAATDVLRFYCEDFAWRSIYARKPLGSTCSAYRGRVNCDAVLGALAN